jgi:hypothetical protein
MKETKGGHRSAEASYDAIVRAGMANEIVNQASGGATALQSRPTGQGGVAGTDAR